MNSCSIGVLRSDRGYNEASVTWAHFRLAAIRLPLYPAATPTTTCPRALPWGGGGDAIRLASFIVANHERILGEWLEFARSQLPWARGLSETVLRDHGDELVRALAADMEQQQSDRERAEKSKGRRADSALAAIGRKHAAGRLSSGLPIKQLVGEYRALRASVLRLWAEARGEEDRDLARFNEAIDETLSESVSRYAETVTSTREQFLAILGHDLRNPLGAIAMGAELLMKNEALDDQGARVATRIYTSVQRTERLVNDLLDFARTRLGGDIPLSTRRLDLTDLCRQVVSELEAVHPACRVRLRMSGDLTGEWDGDRLAQALSNLVANAIEHGCEDGPVEVAAFGDKEDVVVRIHNEGPPIPEPALKTIFDPMVRYNAAHRADRNPSGLGLGLYIAQQIVSAHEGSIEIRSAEGEGTTVTVRVPRGGPAASRAASEDAPGPFAHA
jgi:signal transduction histidine kinase